MRPTASFVGQPIRSLQTMLRVISEANDNIPTVVPDGIYSPETMRSVSAFQSVHGLPVTGITDARTWNEIVAAYDDSLIRIGKAQPIEILLEPNQIIKAGETNPLLYLLQAMLTYLSVLHDPISKPSQNGVLDTSTADALKGFQVLAGLPPTGELDRQTWRYLVAHFTLNAAFDSILNKI